MNTNKSCSIYVLVWQMLRLHLVQGGVQGSIRSWVELSDVGVLIYNISGNRWCGNVDRAHKSNGALIPPMLTPIIAYHT